MEEPTQYEITTNGIAHDEQMEQQRFKTIGVRIEEGLHAQLSFIAQLTGGTITDEIRRSLEARVQAAQDDPDLIARAEQVRSEIEREAEARRQAISGFFGQVAVDGAGANPTPLEPKSTGRRPSPGRRSARIERAPEAS